MRRKNIYVVLFILISFIVLGIGYAAIGNINLIANGSLSAIADQSNFDVKFLSTGVNAPTIQSSPTNSIIVTSNTTASFNIASLVEKNDSVTATLKVKNESNNIGARISLNLTNSNSEYFKVTEHIDDTELKVGDITTVTVTVEMVKTAFENNQTANIVATLIVSPIEEVTATGNNSAENVVPASWELPVGRIATNLQVGDELQYKDQSFYFIRYDENSKAVLLAKYNLNVGNNPKGGVETFLQDSDVRGFKDGYTKYGNVAFSATNYWMNGNTLKSPYNENNTIYYDSSASWFRYVSDDTQAYPTVYDNTYVTAPNSNYDNTGYSIAYYVEEYKNKLEGVGYGATIDDARLLLYSEASSLTGAYVSILKETSFWFGSVYGTGEVWRWEDFDDSCFVDMYSSNYHYGVRPVLVISPSNI